MVKVDQWLHSACTVIGCTVVAHWFVARWFTDIRHPTPYILHTPTHTVGGMNGVGFANSEMLFLRVEGEDGMTSHEQLSQLFYVKKMLLKHLCKRLAAQPSNCSMPDWCINVVDESLQMREWKTAFYRNIGFTMVRGDIENPETTIELVYDTTTYQL